MLALGAGLLAFPIACGGEDSGEAPSGADGWQVERSTEGEVTTVRNLAGSKWGADATLELVLEIGVEEGEQEYMLAQPRAFWATDDEIFVLDARLNMVRVYGRDGVHHRDDGVVQAPAAPGHQTRRSPRQP